jgi:hypothetical protein
VLAAGASGSETLPELVALLHRIPFYDFDAFAFSDAAAGAPLSALLALLVVKLGLADTFAIDLRTLACVGLCLLCSLLLTRNPSCPRARRVPRAVRRLLTLRTRPRTRRRFTRAVERRMPGNGYHNAEHIADVVHSVAILLTGGLQDLVGLQEDPLCVLALLVAAAVHGKPRT